MSESERAALLARWIKPSSDSEQVQQERALRMVREAVDAHDSLKSAQLVVYAKGSYPNNTNVRLDSDVDVVVECHDCCYFDYMPGQQPAERSHAPYAGVWSPERLRAEVVLAMQEKFGASGVDASGKVAIEISPVAGSRPGIDVVPSFDYYLYNDPRRSSWRQGSCVFTRTGSKIVNWPEQQLRNGRVKNDRTGRRYKHFVRAFKNAENRLVTDGAIKAKPSYFMECLIWNVADATLQMGDLSTGFRATLSELWNGLDGDDKDEWTEPNDIKYLFRKDAAWSIADAKELVLKTWQYLDY